MSAMHIAAWSLAWTFAILLVVACGGNRNLARELRNERAARRVAEASVRAMQRQQEEPAKVTPFFGSERHLRAVEALAANEAARFDPDSADWGGTA